MARHNLQSVGLRIVFEFCQTLTLLDTSVISDILLGMPSIDYKIYLVARFHLRRLYKVLKKVNYYATNTYTIKLLHTHDVFGIRQHFVANRMHAFLRCIKVHRHNAALLKFHSNKSNTVYMMSRDQKYRTANHNVLY